MKKLLAITLTLLMAFTVAVFSASAADADVAAIGETTYETLAQAIENAHSPINDRDDIHPIKTTPKKEINPIVLQKTSSGKSDK